MGKKNVAIATLNGSTNISNSYDNVNYTRQLEVNPNNLVTEALHYQTVPLKTGEFPTPIPNVDAQFTKHTLQSTQDDRHSKTAINPLGRHKEFRRTLGNIKDELEGDQYEGKLMVAEEHLIEQPVEALQVLNVPAEKAITLKEYYKQEGIKSALEQPITEPFENRKKTEDEQELQQEVLQKEHLTQIPKYKSAETDYQKEKNIEQQKNYKETEYRPAMNAENSQLLGVQSDWQYEEESPHKMQEGTLAGNQDQNLENQNLRVLDQNERRKGEGESQKFNYTKVTPSVQEGKIEGIEKIMANKEFEGRIDGQNDFPELE